MTDLPPGWEWTTLGEVAESALGKMLDRGKSTGTHPVPYLRNINVQWGRIDTADLLTMDILPEDRERFGLRKGDLLVCEGGDIGRCAIWSGSSNDYMAFQKALHRLRPHGGIDSRFLRYLLEHLSLSKALLPYATGSTIKHLPQQQLRRVPIPLPPLAEQRRIVAALEDHLSRIDSGRQLVGENEQRLARLSKRVIVGSVPIPGPSSWRMATVADAGTVELGRQRHPDWHMGQHMRPYLRVANVFEDTIDTSSLMEMDFPPDIFERFRLREGDILLNEGQSPVFLGRPAMYRGIPDSVAFTNSLLRFRSSSDVDPEWALLVFRRHMHAGRFIKEVRITTNIAHLSAGRFKAIEFPIPPLPEQRRIVSVVQGQLTDIAKMRDSLARARIQTEVLRQSLLRQAFTGSLVPQHTDDEPASVLLNRIRAERADQPKTKRARRTTKEKDALL